MLFRSITSIIVKDDGYGNTTICNNTLTGTSGTLTCSIPTQYQNVSFFVETYSSGDLLGIKYFTQGQIVDWQGADILIYLLMFSALVLLFMGHPITMIVGALAGLTLPVILITSAEGSFSSIIGATLYYIAGGIIAIMVLYKRRNG